MLCKLQEKNPNLKILSVHSSAFNRYGKILNPDGFIDVFKYLENETKVPEFENYYIAHDPKLQTSIKDVIAISNVFGNMPVEYGYVNGNNSKLNALEYHKSSEINVAITPLILMLGRVEDISNHEYSSRKVEIFYIPEHTVIEIYPQTLHFSPCKVNDSGFKCGVILPYGTNMEFINSKNMINDEDHLLFKTNKWILVHEEHQKFTALGAHAGLKDENIEIKY